MAGRRKYAQLFVCLQPGSNLAFSVEPYKGNCSLLFTKEARIFKGRLQLHNINSKINVEVKGNRIGSISIPQLKQMIYLFTADVQV